VVIRWGLALALVAAGCSGGDDGSDAPANTDDTVGEQTSAGSTLGTTTRTGGSTSETGAGGGASTGGTAGSAVECEAGWDVEDPDGSGCDDGAEDDTFGMGDDMPVSIYSVQQGEVPADTAVVLESVLVISPSAVGEALGGRELFVQELSGGAYSGLRVSVPEVGALAEVGDTVELHGTLTTHNGHWILQVVRAGDFLLTGTAAPPAPPVVPIQDLAVGTETARSYEGILVRVEDATVTDPDPCDGEFVLDDAVRVDDRFMPNALAVPVTGQVFTAVEGVVIFAEDSYELAPPDPSAVQ